jgi:pyruvate dehydrogenase E2 component (dihydrolipoamide acetyltransferase)
MASDAAFERRDASLAEGIAFFALGGEGPPALLLHGFGSDHFLWLANQQAVAKAATVAALDLPGHGESSLDVGDGTIAAVAERVAAILDRKDMRKAHLIGHSLGGGVALVLAERRPDLVASLVLIAPAGLGRGVDHRFLSEYPRLAAPDATASLLQRLVVRPRLINKFMVGRVLNQLARPGARDALERIAQGIEMSEAAVRRAAAAIAARDLPRLIVWGKEDAINPLSEARLGALGGDILLVEGAGHLPHVEAPRLVNDRIVDFLARGAIGARDAKANG